jgi:iron complex transport system substrate-binding protein
LRFIALALLTITTFITACNKDASGGRVLGSSAERNEREPVEDPNTLPTYLIDDYGDSVALGLNPQRIISLNPATTEMLFTLGAGNRIIGRTEYDAWPAEALKIPSFGKGIRPNVESILAAKPDLVLIYASLDNRAAATRMRNAGVNTLSLKIDTIGDFKRTIMVLGKVLGDTAKAQLVRDSVLRTLDSIRVVTANLPRPTIFWHIWDAPLLTIGKLSFMNELVEAAGGRNVYDDINQVSPAVSVEDVVKRNPRYVLAGPKGAALMYSDPRWSRLEAIRNKRIIIVDTMLVSRQSVRMGEAAVSLARMLHPELVGNSR